MIDFLSDGITYYVTKDQFMVLILWVNCFQHSYLMDLGRFVLYTKHGPPNETMKRPWKRAGNGGKQFTKVVLFRTSSGTFVITTLTFGDPYKSDERQARRSHNPEKIWFNTVTIFVRKGQTLKKLEGAGAWGLVLEIANQD